VVPETVSSEPVDWRVDLPDFIARERFYPWIADIVSYHGEDPVTLRYRAAVAGELRGLYLQEDQSKDEETDHVLEDLALFWAE